MALGKSLSFVLVLLCLSLHFVPVSTELTDKDIAIISDITRNTVGRLIADSEARMNLKLDNLNESLTATINSGFQDLHSFSQRRAGPDGKICGNTFG